MNALFNEGAFFNAAALTELKADEGLRKDAADLAKLDPEALQRLNRRILDLVFPGAFAPAKTDLARPQARLVYSPYDPVPWSSRSWTFCDAVEKWEGDTLTFKTPDLPYGFCMFRVVLFGPFDKDSISPLTAEFPVCVIEPRQDGTLAFVSNKERDAFVQGETIWLEAVFRSKGARSAGNRTVVLKHPDGREDRLAVKDAGDFLSVLGGALSARTTLTRALWFAINSRQRRGDKVRNKDNGSRSCRVCCDEPAHAEPDQNFAPNRTILEEQMLGSGEFSCRMRELL